MARPDWTEAQFRQPRMIVAATSKAEALRAFTEVGEPMSRNYLNTYGSETGNDIEVEVAMSKPGAVFYAKVDFPRSTEDFAEAPEI